MTALHIKTGPLAGQRIEVEGDLIIGRENADLTIADGDVSRRHAIVRRTAGGLEIEDLGSKNGTFVDGRRIDGPTSIGEGTRLELGATVVEVATAAGVDVTPAGAPQSDVTAVGVAAATSDRPATVSEGTASSTLTVGPLAPAAGPEMPAARLAPLAALSMTPVGVFHPPARRRGRLATRSLVPVVLSFGSAVLTAIALVTYFALR
jgi:hypothetical protein